METFQFFTFLFIFGAIIGSFLNVIILRTKESKNPFLGRSHCPKCNKKLSFWELIPILSFIFLRGRCIKCKSKISWQYPLLELVTAILFFIAGYFWIYTDNSILELVRNLIAISFLIVIFVYDLRWQLIPDRFSLPAIVIIFLINIFLGVSYLDMISGALVVGGFFMLQFAVSKGRWIGGGDIRIGVLMGIILGLQWGLMALLLAYVVGAVFSIILILASRKKFDSKIAFGTFLTLATVIVLFYGNEISNLIF